MGRIRDRGRCWRREHSEGRSTLRVRLLEFRQFPSEKRIPSSRKKPWLLSWISPLVAAPDQVPVLLRTGLNVNTTENTECEVTQSLDFEPYIYLRFKQSCSLFD